MEIAIVTEKDPDGHIRTIRSTTGLLTPELNEQAKALDEYLTRRIPEIEQELIDEGLLSQTTPESISRQARGGVRLWHALGAKLRALCDQRGIVGRRERRWLWDAVENIYSTPRIKRAKRGRTRVHFEYCYRLSRFPIEFAEQVKWSEWVYFFDSRTVREDPRIDDWLFARVQQGQRVSRALFRQFVVRLNERVRNLDTSELSREELFLIYDTTWKKTSQAVTSSAGARGA
jgi:hypothetical protein